MVNGFFETNYFKPGKALDQRGLLLLGYVGDACMGYRDLSGISQEHQESLVIDL